jgi:hypothetical protein
MWAVPWSQLQVSQDARMPRAVSVAVDLSGVDRRPSRADAFVGSTVDSRRLETRLPIRGPLLARDAHEHSSGRRDDLLAAVDGSRTGGWLAVAKRQIGLVADGERVSAWHRS